jgi:hypothetical protein
VCMRELCSDLIEESVREENLELLNTLENY